MRLTRARAGRVRAFLIIFSQFNVGHSSLPLHSTPFERIKLKIGSRREPLKLKEDPKEAETPWWRFADDLGYERGSGLSSPGFLIKAGRL
jgi:hypothetical protein